MSFPFPFQPGVFSRHFLIMLGADPVLKGPYASHSRAWIGDDSRYKTLQAVEEALVAALSERLPVLLKKYIVAHWATFFLDDVACVLAIVVRMARVIVSEDEYRRRSYLPVFLLLRGSEIDGAMIGITSLVDAFP